MPPSSVLYEELPLIRRLLRVWLVSLMVVSVIVLGTGLQSYIELDIRGEQVTLWQLVRWRVIWWYGWTLITPFVFEYAWRHPLWSSRSMLLLLLGNIVAYALHVALQVAAMYLPAYRMVHETLPEAIRYHIVVSLYLNVFIYWVIVGVANGLRAFWRAQARALRSAELEAQLANARLDALRMQLHPHFLFNTLNGISALMHRDVDAADTMVNRLSRLLRTALERADTHEVALKEERAFLEEYLEIEKVRFGERLAIKIDIDPAVEDFLVPSFVLQPLVENSIKHGIVPSGNRGSIHITAHERAGTLELVVADDGPGMPEDDEVVGTGVGLSNLARRLDRLYGETATLHFGNRRDGGFSATVSMPIRSSSQQLVV